MHAGGSSGADPPHDAPRGIVDESIERAYSVSDAIAPWQSDAAAGAESDGARRLNLNPLRLFRRAKGGGGGGDSGGDSSQTRRWFRRLRRDGGAGDADAQAMHVLVHEPLRSAVSRSSEEVPVTLDTNFDTIGDIVAPDAEQRRSSGTHGAAHAVPAPPIHTAPWYCVSGSVSPKTQASAGDISDVPTSSNWLAPDSWAVDGGIDVYDEGTRAEVESPLGQNVVVVDSVPSSVASTRHPSLDQEGPILARLRRPRGSGSGGGEADDEPVQRSVIRVMSSGAAAAAGRLGLRGVPHAGMRRFGWRHGAEHAVPDDDEVRVLGARRRLGSTDTVLDIEVAPLGVHYLRIYMADGSFVTIACSPDATVADVTSVLGRRLSARGDTRASRLFVVEKGCDRPLAPSECPVRLKDRRLFQAGYTRDDNLEEVGREDLSCILRFVFRPDSVPALTSAMLGDQRYRYEHLNLSDMQLEMVPAFVYRHADWIVSLDLSMNPLADLPVDFAQQCRNLRRLRLSSLALRHVPGAVCAIQTLNHLDLSSNHIDGLSEIALPLLPQLDTLVLLNNRLTALPAYMAQLPLQSINLSNNALEAFPAVLCDVQTLVDIDVSYNAITEVPAAIGQLARLERLVLRGNYVSRLPAELARLEYLVDLDVGCNALQMLGRVLEQPRLVRVAAEHNCITALDARLGDRLATLALAHNPLSRVHLAAPSAAGLTVLDLSHANLASLGAALFAHLGSLTHLVLDYNQLTALPSSIGELQRLESLSCAGNLLTTLPDALGSLRCLTRLDVQDNNLRTLPASLWRCANLCALNASSNVIETLIAPPPPEGAAAPLRASLCALRVADNRLSSDVFALLVLFAELEVLNLSMNDLYEIPPGALAALGELRELYLSSNMLSSLPSDDLEMLPELHVLFLNGNRLQSLPAELGRLKQLHSLDVSNNQLKYNIANWHYEWNWNAIPELRYLNFSGNQRFEIRPLIAHTGQREDNIADFARLKSLQLLGLMEVTMTHQPLPDEGHSRRVRTTQAHINNMPYGIADTLGHHNAINLFDVVVPAYRKNESEAIFGLFEGHGHAFHAGGDIAYFLAESFAASLAYELERAAPTAETALRRTFLRLERLYAERLNILAQAQRRGGGGAAAAAARSMWRAGAGAVVGYLRGTTLHVANVGACLAVVSRHGGLVNVLGTKHEPLNRDEFQRIRNAEGYVALSGLVNDEMRETRSFGRYTLSAIATAVPTVVSVELNDADEFVILANSVFWAYVPYQMAVDLARMDRESPKRASQRLRDTAIAFGAVDEVAVMVITVAALFHEAFDVRTLNVRALNRGMAQTRRVTRRARDSDSTLARLDREVLPPIGHVAIVFTDIKNSTLLWESNPGMQTAMRLHNQLLRRQLRSIGGYEVKTEGDAFMVSFQSVAAAVLWCFSVQIRLLSVDWPQEILDTDDCKPVYGPDGRLLYRGLSVRMGVHWGWPVCEVDPVNTRMDYFGPMVNRAARISSAADGGQIMASHDVIAELERLMGMYEDVGDAPARTGGERHTLRDNIPADIVFLRRLGIGIIAVGERRLKGIETPEHLSLVYPKMLSERYRDMRGFFVAGDSQTHMYEPTSQLVEFEQLRLLAMLCLRLEALSIGKVFPGIMAEDGAHPRLPAERMRIVASKLTRHPELLLGLNTRDDATDTELAITLAHLVTRIHNCVSTFELRAAVDAPASEVHAILASVREMLDIH